MSRRRLTSPNTRRAARAPGGVTVASSLQANVRAGAFSMFCADAYNIDGVTGKVASWQELSTHASGILSIDATHRMAQSTSALQCAVPTANALFRGRVSATFVDQRYISSAAASAWRFLHDGTGSTIYEVFSLDSVAGAKYRLSTSYGSTQRGWNSSQSGTTIASFISNGTDNAVAQSGTVLAVTTPYYTRTRFETTTLDTYLKTALGDDAVYPSPSASDPVATLMLGNRVIVIDSPFAGKWLASVIAKGAYSAAYDAIVKAWISAKYGVV